jgi:hypothetical protein
LGSGLVVIDRFVINLPKMAQPPEKPVLLLAILTGLPVILSDRRRCMYSAAENKSLFCRDFRKKSH